MTDRDIRSIHTAGDGASPEMTSLLRSAYAAPIDDAYWATLERRVMARLRENGPVAWWTVFSEWRAAGLVAAALALVVAGAAIVREQQEIASTRDLAAGAAEYTIFNGSADGVAVAITVPTKSNADAPERYLGLIKP